MEAAARKSQPVIMPDRVGLAESKRNDWVVDLPVDVTLEEAMEPSYWAHVAEQMQPLDHIELRAEDGSWIGFLIVRMCEKNYAKVALDRIVKLEVSMEVPAESVKHKVEWKGPHHKFVVVRIADSQMLQNGFATRDLAIGWMKDHEKTMSP